MSTDLQLWSTCSERKIQFKKKIICCIVHPDIMKILYEETNEYFSTNILQNIT
jgi:hypothetical protein